MEFNSNKPIYIQISDSICEQILSGELPEGGRIKSVRELGADMGVNPNTVMRCFEKLSAEGIITNKRGIGYFICKDAKQTVLARQRQEFLENELPAILKRMKLLGIDADSVLK